MVGTSARLLRLLSLFQGQRYWSGADLAGRLEITSRTLRRDVDKLRSLGYPIHSTTGVDGGYHLGAGSSMPPLLLDDEEAVAVALGLRSAAAGNVRGAEEASLRALAKVEQLLPSRLGRRVSAMQAMIVAPPGRGPAVDARTLSAIAGACRDLETLRFAYCDQGGATTDREVEPLRLVMSTQRWYLVAWDTGRNAWRTFRIDRIQGRPTTGARFTPRDPPSHDLAAYVQRGRSDAWPCRARITIHASADVMLERIPCWVGTIEPAGPRRCFLDVGANSYESIAMHMALLGVDFEVSEPPELVAELRRLAQRYQSSVQARS